MDRGVGRIAPKEPGFDEVAGRSGLGPLRQEEDERGLLLPETPGDLLRAIFLQPDNLVDAAIAFAQKAAGKGVEAPANAIGRLAGELGLAVNDMTLHARSGRRSVFGAAAGLRHMLAPDNSGITFAANADLIWRAMRPSADSSESSPASS